MILGIGGEYFDQIIANCPPPLDETLQLRQRRLQVRGYGMAWDLYKGHTAVEDYLRRYEIALEVEFVRGRPVERVAAEPDHDDSLDDGGVF